MPIQKGTIVIKDYDCVSVGKRRRPGGLCELSLDSTDAVIFVLRMPKKGEYKHSDEDLAAIAARYNNLTEFRKREPKAYDAIVSRKKLKEFCSHMKRGRRERYTDEELRAIAARYTVLKEFREREPKAYDRIHSRKKMEKFCGHMEREGRVPYTDEELADIASRYDDIAVFFKKEKSAYDAMVSRGLLKELCSHMKRKVVPRTEEELAAIAKGYDDLTKFRKEQKNAYAAMQRRGLIDKLCGHMQHNMRTDYTREELAAIASGYHDLSVFRKEQRYPYFAIVRRGLVDELCGHMKRAFHTDYTEKELISIAKKYKTRDEFHKKDGGAYLAAHRRGILDDVCSHMEEVRRPKGFYTKEYCHSVALEYRTRGEFQKGDRNTYNHAFQEGWLDDICGHMEVVGNWMRRKIYAFTFSDGYAYIGLSFDPEHRRRRHTDVEKKKSAVYKHIEETGASYEFKILTDWLDIDIVGKMEDDYIKKYAAEGWKMLNRVKGGALGTPKPKKKKKNG